MNTWMNFELNRHPAQVPRTKIEFWGGLISDLEHCAVVVIGLGKNLLFKSVLAHCEDARKVLSKVWYSLPSADIDFSKLRISLQNGYHPVVRTINTIHYYAMCRAPISRIFVSQMFDFPIAVLTLQRKGHFMLHNM